MEKGIIITLPKSDDVTEYLAVFSNPIIEECNLRGLKIKLLIHSEVNKANFEKTVKSFNYNFLILNGHGAIDCIAGYKEEEIIKVGDNEQILCDRITYARSCWAALGVGKSCMVKNKEGCFIGYTIPFMFLIDTTWVTNPIKDNTARIFFETSNLIPLGLIKGQTAKQSDENCKKSMLKAIKKALLKGDSDSQVIAETLWNNYFGQILLGNLEARI